MYEPGATLAMVPKYTLNAVTKGKVLAWDTTENTYLLKPAAANLLGPFAVAVKSAATTDPIVLVTVPESMVYVEAGGTIKPGAKVVLSFCCVLR